MFVGKARVFLARRVKTISRPFPRVRDRQGGSDDQHFAHAPFGIGLKNHPADSRVNRKPG